MRKYFEGHSLTGVVIILSVFLLGLILRFYDPSSLSPWTDELASWWYLRHLDEVFGRESHSPVYYGILRLFLGSDATISGIRTFTAAISAIHLVEFFFLGQRVFKRNQFLVFWILICLSPADIVYARMARHYSWLLEGILVYALLCRGNYPRWLRFVTATFMGFLHVFSLIPIGVISVFDFLKKRKWKPLILDLLPMTPVLFYYVLRVMFFGEKHVARNVSWNSDGLLPFLELCMTQFLGDAYPHYIFDPVNRWVAGFIVGSTFLLILWKKKESGILFFLMILGSLIAIEVLAFWLNLRVNRYVIYLIGLWILALTDILESEKEYVPVIVLGLSLLLVLYCNPLKVYPWENEKVEVWKDFKSTSTGMPELVCSNRYQSDYYGLNAPVLCRDELKSVDFHRPLLFFDLNGLDTVLLVQLMESMDVVDYRALKFGVMARFTPKETNGNVKK